MYPVSRPWRDEVAHPLVSIAVVVVCPLSGRPTRPGYLPAQPECAKRTPFSYSRRFDARLKVSDILADAQAFQRPGG